MTHHFNVIIAGMLPSEMTIWYIINATEEIKINLGVVETYSQFRIPFECHMKKSI